MEIVKERLEREFNLALITTSPTVVYEVIKTNKETLKIDNPKLLPDKSQIDSIKEPYVNISLYTPKKYLGGLLDLCEKRRGIQKNINFISEDRAILEYELPMSEMIYDFYNKVKSITKGYCSMDYEPSELQESKLIKLDILINDEKYQLHDWEKKNIYVKKIGSELSQLVNETILNMRRYLIDKKISELKDNSNDDKDKVLEEVMSYYSLKKLLSAKLNRVV